MKRILPLILITALATIELFAQARAPKSTRAAVVYHYYGVTKATGTLQLLSSSADPDFFGNTYGKGTAATELFNTFAIVYKSPSKLAGVNFIWKDDHGQPGVRWNQHVEVPSGPPMPERQWQSPPPMPGTITNMFNATNTQAILPEPAIATPANGGGASSVLPDTVPPVVSAFDVEDGNITNFPVRVPLSSTYIKRAPGQGSWNDRESGQSTRQIFDVRFATQSNSFYTVWRASDLNLLWIEYPTPTNLHPARAVFTNEMVLPILAGNRFYQVRAATLQ